MSNLPFALRRRFAGHSDVVLRPPTWKQWQRFSWWLRSLAIAVTVMGIAIFGAMVIILLDAAWNKTDGINDLRPSLLDDMSRTASTARLLVSNQEGFVNEPLALGLSIENTSGDETVTLIGLAAGTNVSPANPLGLTGWRVTGRDLAKTRAYPPKDFVGFMVATAKLIGGGNQVLDTQIVRLRWLRNSSDGLVAAPASPPTEAVEARGPEDIATLMHRAEEALKQGDIASARLFLRRASEVGTDQASDVDERTTVWGLRSTTGPSSVALPPQPESRLASVGKPRSTAVREGLITKAPAR